MGETPAIDNALAEGGVDNLSEDAEDVAMERLNLNIPANSRAELKSLAAEHGKREAELARELLIKAIDAERRRLFFEQLSAAMTPERKQRLIELAAAMDQVRGE